MFKLNKEQIDAIVEAHVAGRLSRQGAFVNPNRPCVLQVAHGVQSLIDYDYGTAAKQTQVRLALAFDHEYAPTWTSEYFMEWMNKQGVL